MHLQFSQELGIWAYVLLAVLVMVEGPVATLAGAVAAASGLMKPALVFLAASVGNLIGDSLWYTLGYLGKMDWLEKYGGKAGVKKSTIKRLEAGIHKNAPKLIFIAKLTLGFTIPTLVATGLARIPLRRWLWVNILAETIWTGVLVFLGYNFGKYLQRLERGVEIFTIAGSLIFVMIVIWYITHSRQNAAKEEEEESNEASG